MQWLREMLSGFISLLGRRKAFVDINPRYELLLKSQGLTASEHFLSLPAIIVSGHPDRHVARVVLSAGPNTIKGFLKKEHRVPWRDRLANAVAGFGFCSKSYREAIMLRAVQDAGIGSPEFLAAGEDGHGRSFLLVSDLGSAVDLRNFLEDRRQTPSQRRGLAKELGATLARIHNAGFQHRDLYSKHILVNTKPVEIHILDWQRARRPSQVTWRQLRRDLAALDASLAEHLANSRERLACLRSYFSATLSRSLDRPLLLRTARAIRRQSLKLLCRRKIREMRQPISATTSQHLVWLKGEELCVTREFYEASNGQMPEFLTSRMTSKYLQDFQKTEQVEIPGVGPAALVLRRASRPLRWAWSWLSRRRFFSSEQEKAGIIFRLERHGVPTPRLLAFGQRSAAWRSESFLLTKNLDRTTDFAQWLSDHFKSRRIAETKQCRAMLRGAGALLRRMHEAHCYFGTGGTIPLEVQAIPGHPPTVVLGGLEGICKRHRPSRALAVKNLRTFLRNLAGVNLNRSDYLRFLLSYLDQTRLRPRIQRRSRIEHRWRSLASSLFGLRSSILDLLWGLAG